MTASQHMETHETVRKATTTRKCNESEIGSTERLDRRNAQPLIQTRALNLSRQRTLMSTFGSPVSSTNLSTHADRRPDAQMSPRKGAQRERDAINVKSVTGRFPNSSGDCLEAGRPAEATSSLVGTPAHKILCVPHAGAYA